MTTTIPVYQARQKLGEIIEEAYYLGKPFILKRGKKTMAAIIGANEFGRFLELVEKYDPGLADTLAIMSNPEVRTILEEGEKEIKKGSVVPFDKKLLKSR